MARDEILTAGSPHAITLDAGHGGDPRRREIAAIPGRRVTDHSGAGVPDASNLIRFAITGPGTLARVDNGQQENAQIYQTSSVPAFNGRALVIVRSTALAASPFKVTATSPGLAPASATITSVPSVGQPRPAVASMPDAAGCPAGRYVGACSLTRATGRPAPRAV